MKIDHILVALSRPVCLIGGGALFIGALAVGLVCAINVVFRFGMVCSGIQVVKQLLTVGVAGAGFVISCFGIWLGFSAVRMCFGKYENRDNIEIKKSANK